MAAQLRAIVYSRVSTDAQERDGTSLDSQESASQEYVGANGWMLLESIKDTASSCEEGSRHTSKVMLKGLH